MNRQRKKGSLPGWSPNPKRFRDDPANWLDCVAFVFMLATLIGSAVKLIAG